MYILSKGGCVVTFTMIPATLSYGGAEQRAAQTLDQCQELCKQASTCVEIDFDQSPTANIRCFTHDTARPRSQAQGVNKYVKQQTGCGKSFYFLLNASLQKQQ